MAERADGENNQQHHSNESLIVQILNDEICFSDQFARWTASLEKRFQQTDDSNCCKSGLLCSHISAFWSNSIQKMQDQWCPTRFPELVPNQHTSMSSVKLKQANEYTESCIQTVFAGNDVPWSKFCLCVFPFWRSTSLWWSFPLVMKWKYKFVISV
jgi:hypothetical protein